MPATAGKSGKVMIGANTVALLDDWKFDGDRKLIPVTSFGDDWEKFVAGLASATGTANGKCDMSDINGQLAMHNAWLNGTTVALKLYIDATHYWSGTAWINKVSPSASISDKSAISFSFTFDGAIIYT